MNPRSTPPQKEYRFGNCVLRSDTRELLRDGQVQKIERRSFDLIHYLLRQEGRVVGKDELLENVWSNRYVTDSVIAQSIMKARKALGITGREEGPIRTVHRVGYRFVGELRPEARPASATFAEQPRTAPGVHWLPTEADESLAGQPWMKTGLISLVAHLLRSNGVVVHHDAGENEDPAVNPGRSARPSMAVVHTRMRQTHERYALHWRLQWGSSDHHGSAEGGSPVELFLRAAIEVALLVRLRALAVAGIETHAEPCRDLLRLLQLCDNLDTHEHAPPLDTLMGHLQTDPPGQWAECLLILAQRGEDSTPYHAREMARRAHERDEHGHAGWAELCLGLHALYVPDRDTARAHVGQAIALLLLAQPGGRVAEGLALASHVLATLGDLEQAEHTLSHAVQINGHGMSCSTVAWQDLQASELRVLHGDLASHGAVFAKAVSSCRQLGLDALTAFALGFHALHHFARGEWATARQQLQTAQWISDRGGWPRARIFANLHLGLLCARMEDREELDRCVVRLGERRLSGTWLGDAALKWLRARVCVLNEDFEAALPLLEEARHRLSGLGAWWPEDAWLFEGQILLKVGRRSCAEALLEHLRQRGREHDRPHQRASAMALEALLAMSDARTVLASTLLERAAALATGSVLDPTLAMLQARWRSEHGELARPAGNSADPLLRDANPHLRDRSVRLIDNVRHAPRRSPCTIAPSDADRPAGAAPQDRPDMTWRAWNL